MPIHVAIVEDDQKAAGTLQNHLERYGGENEIQFRIKTFEHPLRFLEPYTADYDLVYMDIQMSLMNGMDANTFAPQGKTTRAQFITTLYRAFFI